MSELRRGERGASILASLVVVAMLGGVALVADVVGVQRTSQTAAPGVLTTDVPLPPNTSPEAAAAREQLRKKCDDAIAKAKSSGKETTSKVGQRADDDCVAAIKDPAYKSKGGYKCVGKSAQVLMRTDGILNINWQANPNVSPGTCATVACNPTPTQVQTFVGIKGTTAKCVPVELTGLSKSSIQKALDSSAAFNAMMDPLGIAGIRDGYLSPDRPLSQPDLDVLNKALGRDPNSTEANIYLDSKGDLAPGAYDKIKEIAEGTPNLEAQTVSQEVSEEVCKSNPTLCTDVSKLTPESPSIEKDCPKTGNVTTCFVYSENRSKELTAQGYKCNSAGDGSWACNKASTSPGNDPPKPGTQCPPNTYGTPPNCTSYSRDTFNRDPGPQTRTPQPSGGLQGLFGGQPPPGNQTPKPPGTCSAGQTICQGNTLYSRNSQCVDTPVQYCPYGCAQQQTSNTSGWTALFSMFGGGQQTTSGQCAQPPQQCQQAPPQPNPANCPNGIWKPTYGPPLQGGTQTPYGQPPYGTANNTCVTGWQCVPNTGGDGQLTAQLSCEPKVADVGMTLAISYSCSLGASSGSGFDTNGAQSGTSTATIANPQGNANTATYTLTCTNAGQTTTASCNVQVARPTIVLIANPASVESGKTSALGWVTSGMKSCVISSPDLSDFTSQNTNNTSVNGTAVTPPLSSTAVFVLNCNTAGGSTRQASTTVKVL